MKNLYITELMLYCFAYYDLSSFLICQKGSNWNILDKYQAKHTYHI